MERKRYTQADLEKQLEAMIAERGSKSAPLVSSTLHAEVRELQKRNKELAEQMAKKAPVEKKEEPKKETPKKKPQTKKKPEPKKKKEEPQRKITKGPGDTGKPAKQGGPTTLGDALGIPYEYRRTKETARAVGTSTRRDKKIR